MTSATQPATTNRKVVVATHGHCFDGMSSAALFTRLMQHLHGNDAFQFEYRSCGYGPGQNGVDPKVLNGDINAILDFRFTATPVLTWYFDHHVSAFVTAEDRAFYNGHVTAHGEGARQMFHDGTYSSCTKLIADIAKAKFGLDLSALDELVRWADIIDSAAFPNAKMAVERSEPVLKLMTVVEHQADDAFLTKIVPRLLSSSLSEVATAPDILAAYEPLGRAHESFVTMVRDRAKESGGVVYVDMTDVLLEVAGKFVTYALYPSSAYSVLLSRSKSKCKISIGYNPWSNVDRKHNIAAICERHGGGGHPVVGAISLAADKLDDAKKIATDIAKELST